MYILVVLELAQNIRDVRVEAHLVAVLVKDFVDVLFFAALDGRRDVRVDPVCRSDEAVRPLSCLDVIESPAASERARAPERPESVVEVEADQSRHPLLALGALLTVMRRSCSIDVIVGGVAPG